MMKKPSVWDKMRIKHLPIKPEEPTLGLSPRIIAKISKEQLQGHIRRIENAFMFGTEKKP